MYQRNPTTPEDEKRKSDLLQSMAKELLQFTAVDRHEVFSSLSLVLEEQHKKDVAIAHQQLEEQSKYLDHLRNLSFRETINSNYRRKYRINPTP